MEITVESTAIHGSNLDIDFQVNLETWGYEPANGLGPGWDFDGYEASVDLGNGFKQELRGSTLDAVFNDCEAKLEKEVWKNFDLMGA